MFPLIFPDGERRDDDPGIERCVHHVEGGCYDWFGLPTQQYRDISITVGPMVIARATAEQERGFDVVTLGELSHEGECRVVGGTVDGSHLDPREFADLRLAR